MTEIIPQSSYKIVPWKNGTGITREIFCYPSAENYSLRFSVADIKESGPFSLFTGFERCLTQLSGGRLELFHDGSSTRKILSVEEPYFFSGDETTRCTYSGDPGTDFNVMFDPKKFSAQVRIIDKQNIEMHSSFLSVFYVLNGALTFDSKDLKPGDTIIIRNNTGLQALKGLNSSRVLWTEIFKRGE